MANTKHVWFTAAARSTGIPLDELREAALEAVGNPVSQELWFKAFRVRGRQFAISTHLIVEVDYFPHRVPDVVLVRSRQ